jgi:hypothetical protein
MGMLHTGRVKTAARAHANMRCEGHDSTRTPPNSFFFRHRGLVRLGNTVLQVMRQEQRLGCFERISCKILFLL